MIEGLDPEEASAIIDPALQLMMDAVHRYEGYVAQALGDGIFALFGAPIAHEDHPQRALYAAFRMQEEMRRYGDAVRLRQARLCYARRNEHRRSGRALDPQRRSAYGLCPDRSLHQSGGPDGANGDAGSILVRARPASPRATLRFKTWASADQRSGSAVDRLRSPRGRAVAHHCKWRPGGG